MSALIPENIEELVAEYKRIWPLMPRLHAEISKLADKNAIKACAKRLKPAGDTHLLNFEQQGEREMIQDYLNYMYQPRGFSLVRQLRNRKRYAAESDEQQLLERMIKARFSLFWIKELHPAGGFIALDMITGEELFILDQSVHQLEVTGEVTALRIFPFQGVWMHTGAGISLGNINDDKSLQPINSDINIKEEEALNRKVIIVWREMIRNQD